MSWPQTKKVRMAADTVGSYYLKNGKNRIKKIHRQVYFIYVNIK